MADILIRGMEMPEMPERMKHEQEEPYVDIRVFASGKAVISTGKRPYYKEFDVVHLPKKHGRLIDADAFKAVCLSATKEAKPDFIRHEDWLKSCAITMSFCRDIDERPTIVPAEGGGAQWMRNG